MFNKKRLIYIVAILIMVVIAQLIRNNYAYYGASEIINKANIVLSTPTLKEANITTNRTYNGLRFGFGNEIKVENIIPDANNKVYVIYKVDELKPLTEYAMDIRVNIDNPNNHQMQLGYSYLTPEIEKEVTQTKIDGEAVPINNENGEYLKRFQIVTDELGEKYIYFEVILEEDMEKVNFTISEILIRVEESDA